MPEVSTRVCRAVLVGLALALVQSCNAGLDEVERSVSQAEQRQRDVSLTYALSERDVREMRRMLTEMEATVTTALQNLERARSLYDQASRLHLQAAEQFSKAQRDYEEAEAAYRRVAVTIIVAAASTWFLQGLCGPDVSTQSYRRELARDGVDLGGMDIDHIIARAHGGPNRPWNYMPLESGINRSLQEGGLSTKLMVHPIATLRAMVGYALYALKC